MLRWSPCGQQSAVLRAPLCTSPPPAAPRRAAASQLSCRLLTFGINLAIARYLSPEAYGVSGAPPATMHVHSKLACSRASCLCPVPRARRSCPPSSFIC